MGSLRLALRQDCSPTITRLISFGFVTSIGIRPPFVSGAIASFGCPPPPQRGIAIQKPCGLCLLGIALRRAAYDICIRGRPFRLNCRGTCLDPSPIARYLRLAPGRFATALPARMLLVNASGRYLGIDRRSCLPHETLAWKMSVGGGHVEATRWYHSRCS